MDASSNHEFPLPDDARRVVDDLDQLIGSMVAQDRPVDALLTIRAVGDVASGRSAAAVAAAIDGESSWADVGDALGISKQAAHQRFGAKLKRVRADLDKVQRDADDTIGTQFDKGRATLDAYLAKHPHKAEEVAIARAHLEADEQRQRAKVERKLDKAREQVTTHAQRRLEKVRRDK